MDPDQKRRREHEHAIVGKHGVCVSQRRRWARDVLEHLLGD
jgi:hypothetical protein